MALLEPIKNKEGRTTGYKAFCPGCGFSHSVYTALPNPAKMKHGFNGSMNEPTFEPSVMVRWTYGPNKVEKRCHSYIVNGTWQFLNDCTHSLKGRTVKMKEV